METPSFDLSRVALEDLSKIDYVEAEGVYKASPWGVRCHRIRAEEALVAGAAGPGKSLFLLHDAVPSVLVAHELCRRGVYKWGHIEDTNIHLRRELSGLNNTIRRAKKLFPLIDPQVRFMEKDSKFLFKSGFEFHFGHCKNPDDWEKYYGLSYIHIAFDELREFEQEQYDQISSRTRSDNSVLVKMLKVRAATNPGPGWVRERFVDPAPQGNKRIVRTLTRADGTKEKHTLIYIPATLYDNPNKEFVREYEKKLLSLPKHIQEAQLRGNWYYVTGGYYADDWVPSLHIIRPFKIPSDWYVFRSCDWGYKNQGVVQWWAQDPDGNLICWNEWSFRLMDGTVVAKKIKEFEMKHGLANAKKSKLSGPADTNLWSEYSQTDSHGMKMAKEGVFWVPGDKRDRQMNAERLCVRLKDHENGLTRPGIMWFDTCRKSIETIPAIKGDKNDSNVPEKSDIDHWADCAQFACAYATPDPKRLASRIVRGDTRAQDDDEKFYDDQEHKRGSANRGKLGYG